MSDGNRNNNNKNNNNKYVRPVLAYLVKNIIKAEPEFLSSRWRKRAYFFIKKGLPTAAAVMCQRAVNTGRASSTENSSNNAWNLWMDDGNRNNNNKNNNKYVRPVLAYLIENIIRTEPEFLSPRWGKWAYFFIKKGLPTAAAVMCQRAASTGRWSSTEYNNNNAWKLRMSDGNRDWNNKNNNNNYVRPVLAYLVKNIIRTEPESLSPRWGERAYFFIKKGLPTAAAVMCQRAVNTGRASSTENSSNNAWNLWMDDGNRNNNNKNNNKYVRPVLAYLIENIIRTEPEFLSPRWGKWAYFFIKKGLPTASAVMCQRAANTGRLVLYWVRQQQCVEIAYEWR